MKPTQASRCRIWSCACTSASVVSDPTYKRWPLPSMDCEWKRSSPRGKRFMRGLPRFTNDQEVNRLSLLPEVKPHQQKMSSTRGSATTCQSEPCSTRCIIGGGLRRHGRRALASTSTAHSATRCGRLRRTRGLPAVPRRLLAQMSPQRECPEQRRCQGAGAMSNLVLRDIPPLSSSLSLASASGAFWLHTQLASRFAIPPEAERL